MFLPSMNNCFAFIRTFVLFIIYQLICVDPQVVFHQSSISFLYKENNIWQDKQ